MLKLFRRRFIAFSENAFDECRGLPVWLRSGERLWLVFSTGNEFSAMPINRGSLMGTLGDAV